MGFLIATAILLILSLNISLIFKKSIALTIPAVVASISFTLYLFGLVNYRYIGIWTITLACLASSIYLVYKSIKNQTTKEVVKKIISPGLIYYLVMIVVIYLISRGFVFTAWDEFSHWGLILKNLFATNNFGNLNDTTTLFKSYPPGISLFLSYFNSFSSTFNESYALRGMLLLSVSQLAILFYCIKNIEIKTTTIISTILFIFPTIVFGTFYGTIYVDAILGLIFGNILFFNYIYRKKDIFYAVYMSLQFFLLTSTKQIGIGLVAIASIIILTDFIISKKINLRSFTKNIFNKEFVYTITPMAVALITAVSWKLYLKIYNISEQFSVSPINLTDLLNITHTYRKTVIVNFINNFFAIKQFGSFQLSYFSISIILFIIIYFVIKKSSTLPKKPNLSSALILPGFYIYCGVILFMYLFSFSEYEAIKLASSERYIGSFLLGFLMFSLFILVNYILKIKDKNNLSPLYLLSIMLVLFCAAPVTDVLKNTLFSTTDNNSKQFLRSNYDILNKYSNDLKNSTDKVYIISQNTTGFDFWVNRYILTPMKASPSGWSLGKPYSESDIWTVKKTVAQFQTELKGYNFLYLYSIDQRFIDDYGTIFNGTDIKNRSLYKVVPNANNIMLELVTNE